MKYLLDTLGIEKLSRTWFGVGSSYNSYDDFKAIPNLKTNTITVSALPFTLRAEDITHIYGDDGEYYQWVKTGGFTVSGNIITVIEADKFESGDLVHVHIKGPSRQ